jgi:hypothetical protein
VDNTRLADKDDTEKSSRSGIAWKNSPRSVMNLHRCRDYRPVNFKSYRGQISSGGYSQCQFFPLIVNP